MTAATIACRSCGTTGALGSRFCRSCGAALGADGEVPAEQASEHSARRPLRQRIRWGWLVGLTTALAAIATAAIIYVDQKVVHPPDQPVRAWFAALAARDTAAAAELSPGTALLRGDLLDSAVYTPPTGLQVLHVSFGAQAGDERPNKSLAYVTVRYEVGGQPVEQTIQVVRGGAGAVRPWSLGDSATGLLDIVAGGMQRARLGQQEVATRPLARDHGTDGAHVVPPGVYTITASTSDVLFTASPVKVAVPGGRRNDRAVTATLDLTVKPAAVAQVDRQVRARIDECAQRHDLTPYDCPFDRTGPYTGTVSSVKWTIVQYPKIRLTPVVKPYQGGPLATMDTETAGFARVAYAAFSTGGKTVTEEIQFQVYGDVRVADGVLTWTGGKSGRLIS